MKRRKTVSVTPAMGARTVAGEIVTVPIVRLDGTGFRALGSMPLGFRRWQSAGRGARATCCLPRTCPLPELSQNFFTVLFYLRAQTKPPPERGLDFWMDPSNP